MIACISIPFFAVAVERRSDATLSHKPVVTGGQPWEPRPIFGFSEEVAHMGVEPGISLRMAHVYAPHSHFMPAHPSQYHEVSAEVTAVLVDFSSRVEAADLWQPPPRPQTHLPTGGRFLPAQFYLDLDGLPQKEAVPLAREAGRTVRTQTHLSPAIGLARHKFTAHVAASLTRPNHLLPTPAEDDTQFLASRSINYLPLDAETHRRLHLLGIHTLGELAALPLLDLRVQFGPEIESCYRMAHGEGDVPVQPQVPEQVEQVSFEFEEPIIDRQTLHRLLDHAAGELAGRLQATSLAGRKVHWQWETDGGGGGQEAVTLREPTAESRRIAAVLQEVVDQACFDAGVTAVSVAIGDLSPVVGQQLSLFPVPMAAGQAHKTLQNVIARHGSGCVYQAVLMDGRHPLPERRFQLHVHDTAVA